MKNIYSAGENARLVNEGKKEGLRERDCERERERESDRFRERKMSMELYERNTVHTVEQWRRKKDQPSERGMGRKRWKEIKRNEDNRMGERSSDRENAKMTKP